MRWGLLGPFLASAPNPWFKLWRAAWTDGRITKLDGCERWLWLTGLKVAGESRPHGLIQVPDEVLGMQAGLPTGACPAHKSAESLGKGTVAKLVAMGTWRRTPKGILVVKWEEYQRSKYHGGAREGAGRPKMSRRRSAQFPGLAVAPRAQRLADSMRSAGVDKVP